VCDRGAPDANGVFAQPPKAGKPYPSTFRCFKVADQNATLNEGENYQPHLSADGSRIVWADFNESPDVVYEEPLTYSASGVLQPPVAANIRFFGPAGPTGSDPEEEFAFDQPQVSADGNWLVMTGFDEGIETPLLAEADLRQATPTVREI